MPSYIRAPYPAPKVTSVLPDPQSADTRATQSTVQLIRGATSANLWSYAKSSDKVNLTVTWILTEAKAAEVAEFVRVYHTATWELQFTHEAKRWEVQLIGRPVRREFTQRQDDDNQVTGNEAVSLTLEFSAKAI